MRTLSATLRVVAHSFGQIDRISHAALAKRALDLIAPLKGCVKSDDRIFDHGV